jgi:hypothetical protein
VKGQWRARALYWLTFGILATVVGGLLWMWSPLVGVVAGAAVAVTAGLLCERFLDGLRR